MRLKSWDDLHKLWYVLLKERNMLKSENDNYRARGLVMPNGRRQTKVAIVFSSDLMQCTHCFASLPERLTSCNLKYEFSYVQVRKSMCRIKYVMYERARAEKDPLKAEQLKQFVNNL